MKTTALILVVLVIGFLPQAAAQPTHFKTVPAGFEMALGSFASNYPFNASPATEPAQRWQWRYSWTQLFHQSPMTIHQIAFRPANDAAVVGGGTLPGCTLVMSTRPPGVQSQTIDCTYANNLSTLMTPSGAVPETQTVFVGDIVVPPYGGGGMGTSPAPFIVQISFNQGLFFYDPTTKRDLIIDLTIPTTVTTGMTANGKVTTFEGGRFGNVQSSTGSQWCGSGSVSNPDYCPVIEIGYSLGSPVHFEMIANTNTGTGNLNLGFNNVPMTATLGVTLISTTPFAGDFGTGPAFGLWPDAITFSTLAIPPAPGNVFKWTWPVPPPNFPAQGLSISAPTLVFLSGQTWELAGVAFDGLGQIAGISQPIQLLW